MLKSAGLLRSAHAFLVVAKIALLWAIALSAQAIAQHHDHAKMAAPKRVACTEATLVCARKATPVFAPDGALWLLWATDDRVLLARSPDLGQSFGAPVKVHNDPLQLDWGPDARPQMVFDAQGRKHVVFNIFKDKAFNGEALYARTATADGPFVPLAQVTKDAESQRFEVVTLKPDGGLLIAWLDKRARAAARQQGLKYPGAGLYFASGDTASGALQDAKLLREGTCECCRLAVAAKPTGVPVILFRNIYDGSMRDHAVIAFDAAGQPGPMHRVSEDNWVTDACPHHGPSLAISPAGTYHAAWFTDGRARQGIFYARSDDEGAKFSEPAPIGSQDKNPSRPFLMAAHGKIWMAWKEFGGADSVLMSKWSGDDGRTWSEPKVVARTADDSDHPILIANANSTFASWLTKADGYRLLKLE
jgi:hypothetical protein